jgi:hypothetical protein
MILVRLLFPLSRETLSTSHLRLRPVSKELLKVLEFEVWAFWQLCPTEKRKKEP